MADPDCSRPARPPRRPRPLAGAVLALFALLTLAPAALAEPDPPAEKLVALRLDWLTHLAREDAAAAEAKALAAQRSPAPTPTLASVQDPAAVLAVLGPALDADYKQVQASVGRVEEKSKARKADALKDWTEAYRQRVAFREAVEKLEATHGFDFETGAAAPLRPDPVDALALVGACFVAVVAVRWRRAEQRLDVRKARRAAGAALLVAGVVLPGCDAPPPGAVRPWAAREEGELTTNCAAAAVRTAAAEAAAEEKWRLTSAAWVALVTAPGGDADKTVRSGEAELRAGLRAAAVDAQLAERLVKDAAVQRAKLTEEAAKLDQITGRAKLWSRAGTGLRVLAAGALFGLATAPLWSARRTRARRLALAARTCPRCFRLDTLKVEEARKKAAADDDGDVRCTKCGLRFRRSYLDVPRLCFPTVGVRSSGKTHMLVTAYDRVRKRTAPTVAAVQPAPTGGDADRRFAQLTDEVLHRHGVAGATDLVLPDPILLHVRDADPAGSSAALVNLFDYSGELINPDVDVNMLKATAVRMDGFMLFLDPTQLYGDAANVTVEQQLAMLDSFLAHMRKERRVPVGEPIPVPVAVCVPKLDLLISDNPIGGQSVQYIHQLLERLNPPPQEVTLGVLRERSELVEQMLPLMFPGLDVRRLIEGYFGPQLLFFPMSSVGLIEHELGVKDLSKRTVVPFGTSEPVVWLLHMHGYSVFG